MTRSSFTLHRFSCFAALAVLAACGETGPSEQLPPAAVANITGIPLTGPAGDVLAERVLVRVVDASQNPLPGVTVTFSVSATGASVSPATAVTNDDGEASTRWTLGRTPGQQTLTVTAGGTSLTITATATSPRIASLAVNSGNNQTGPTNTPLPTAVSVVAKDQAGAPVEGVTVFFTVLTGGGTVTNQSAVTNVSGVASAGSWTLGANTGTQLLSAQVSQNGVAGNPAIFTATASAGAPASVTAISATQQSALAGALVPSAPSVIVRDAAGNAAANVTVNFAVTSGGGQLTGASQTTNSQGVATVGSWRLGATPGANTVTATVTGVAPVTFNATGTAGTPTQLTKSQGDNQTSSVNRAVPIPPQVRVLDAAGNGVAGINVVFTVGVGTDASVIVGNVTTNAEGRATVGAWILGTTPGTYTLIATAQGLGSVTFTATATGGTPTSMQPISSVSQPGIAGQAATSLPSVVVRDALGNPVSGIIVTFAVTAGGGAITGSTQTTDVNGVATLTSWLFGGTAGLNTVVASSPGLSNVSFNATTTGVPVLISVFNGNNQAAVQGTAVSTPPSVRVTDTNGQGVGGVTVTFAVIAGGGSVPGAGTAQTDATGVATVASWTLGSAATQTLSATASAPGVANNPISISAIAATKIAVTAQPTTAASAAPFNVTVQLQNISSVIAPVSGVPLTIAISSGGGTLNGTAVINTTAGTVTFTININHGGTPGNRQLTISGAGLTSAVTANINIT